MYCGEDGGVLYSRLGAGRTSTPPHANLSHPGTPAVRHITASRAGHGGQLGEHGFEICRREVAHVSDPNDLSGELTQSVSEPVPTRPHAPEDIRCAHMGWR